MQCSVTQVSNSLWPHGIKPFRLLCAWDSPGKITGAGCHFLLQGIFPTQGSNPCLLSLLYWQADSLPLVPPGKPPKRTDTTIYKIINKDLVCSTGNSNQYSEITYTGKELKKNRYVYMYK